MLVEQFFDTARERYNIMLARQAGGTHWTDDPVFQQYRFCNVFREDDKTTIWFRENVREPMMFASARRQLLATVAFRTFNLIATGERILPILLKQGWNTEKVRKAMEGAPRIVTGAYIVRTPKGMNKLDGICWRMEEFITGGFDRRVLRASSLQAAHAALIEAPLQGPFTAYEIVSDLRHSLFRHAPDIMTWANPGPGAQRGLRRVFGKTDKPRSIWMLHQMRELLRLSRPDSFYWPESWPQWEMREVEHWLCEFDKYQRAGEGGKMKRRFTC